MIAKLAFKSNMLREDENLPKVGRQKFCNLCKLNKYSINNEYRLNFCECICIIIA